MLRKLYSLLGSPKLTVVVLLLLALLTYLGTLAQVEHGLFESQRRYFDSWLLLHPVRDLRVPLPGGQTLMALLFVNLLIGGFIRMRRTWRLVGIYIVHTGIALLLIAGFVKLRYSDDGYLALYEGDRANFFESHHLWELALGRSGPGGKEVVVGEEVLRRAQGQRVALQSADLPFEVVIDGYAQNARPRPAATVVDGADVVEGHTLLAERPAIEREQDVPGLYLTLRTRAGAEQRMILSGSSMLMPNPRTLPIGDETWFLDLRKRRYALPFALRLDDFRKETHPGTELPSSFESDVTQITGASERAVLIEMNQPLRDAGFVLYQSGWGPQQPGEHSRYYSNFSVVRNPSDQWPLIACLIIAAGLLIHFGNSLWRYVQRETARREASIA